jgi:secreted Zn-dependent insulinase-like peptidase
VLGETHHDNADGTVLLDIKVQSSDYDPVTILSRIETFVCDVESMLNSMSDVNATCAASKQAQQILISERDDVDPRSRHWDEIRRQRYNVRASTSLLEHLQSIQIKNVMKLFNQRIKPCGQERRSIACLVYGAQHHAPAA